MKCLTLLLVMALLTSPHVAGAQTAADLTTHAPRGRHAPHVFVTLFADETPIEGLLLNLSAESVDILSAGVTRRYPLPQVSLIERRGDRTLDGAIKGALIGAVCILTCAQGASDGSHLAQLVFTNAAFGSLLGWWIDHRRVGTTTLHPPASGRRP